MRTAFLSGSNSRHVVMFAETAEIAIQLLDTFLVCLDTFAFEAVLQLRRKVRFGYFGEEEGNREGNGNLLSSVAAPRTASPPRF